MGQTDLRSMKRGFNRIENQSENWYKMTKNVFGERIDQH